MSRKFLVVSLFFFLLPPVFGYSQDDLIGLWFAQSKGETFTLFFQKNGENVVGNHESLWGGGKRVDSTLDPGVAPSPGSFSISIDSFDANKGEAKASFKSGYNEESAGSATIRILDGDEVDWKVNDSTGENYIPDEIRLNRVSGKWLTGKEFKKRLQEMENERKGKTQKPKK